MNMFAEGAERNKALGLWGGIGAAGATVGLIAGGLLTRYAGWQYIFFLNVPIGAAALLLAPRIVPESRLAGVRRRFDPLGAVTVTGALLLLVYAISKAPQAGWGSARTVTLLAVSAALLLAFLVIETRAAAPLLPLRIFRLRTVAVANAVGFLLGGSFFAFIFIGTLYMQQVLGYSALQAGVAWLAASLTSVALAGLAQMLVTRISAGPVMAAGMALIAGGVLWATQVPVQGHFWSALAGPFLVAGAGTAFGFVPISIAGLAGVAKQEAGLASGLLKHLPAARRGDRHRDRIHSCRHPPQDPARRRPDPKRRADRRLPLGSVGLRSDRPARPAGDSHPRPPEDICRPRRCRPSARASGAGESHISSQGGLEMTQVLVRYKVKPEHTEENEQLVRAVYDELQRTEPSGFHYATFQLDDGVTFVHLSSTDSDDGQNPLSEVEAFKRFQDNIGDRCDEPPVVTRLREIGSYHLFGGQGRP